ncbi:unnamed protein product [Lathyrus sativus]|nr:unnamed protein product [Lathyrus sativus]
MALANEEFFVSKVAKEVIKSLASHLKDLAERLPLGVYDDDDMKPTYLPNGFVETNGIHHQDLNGDPHHTRTEYISSSSFPNGGGTIQKTNNSVSHTIDDTDSKNFLEDESSSRSRNDVLSTEWVKQYSFESRLFGFVYF